MTTTTTTNLIDPAVAAKVLARTAHARDIYATNRIGYASERDAWTTARGAAFDAGQAEVLEAAAKVLEAATTEDIAITALLRTLLNVATSPVPVEALSERHLQGRREATDWVLGQISAWS